MASSFVAEVLVRLSRKKPVGSDAELYETPLRRSLNTWQLVFLALASMIGSGIYVVIGVVVKEVTGPAVILSLVIAGIAALLSSFCYSEFACRVPRTGSAYTFIYISIGEIWAFVIGWDLAMEYAVTAASVARSFTGYVDFMLNGTLSNVIISNLIGGNEWSVPYLAPYPDVFAALLLLILTLIVISGAKASTWVAVIITIINLTVITLSVILGAQNSDFNNWRNYGGFVPNGFGSVIAGAATLFALYIGFDVVAVANEETTNPSTSIPRAMFAAVSIAAAGYILTGAVLTLMVPYTDLDERSALSFAFAAHGIEWASIVISVAALCAMATATLMSLYCISRLVYSMARDGLLFRFFGVVNEGTRVPMRAAFFSLALVTVLTVFFSVVHLVEFMSIGALIGNTFVACAVIVLRYQDSENFTSESGTLELVEPNVISMDDDMSREQFRERPNINRDDNNPLLDLPIASSPSPGTLKEYFRAKPGFEKLGKLPAGRLVRICLALSVLFLACTIILLKTGLDSILAGDWWALVLLCILVTFTLLVFLIIPLHCQDEEPVNYFRVPWVPLFPGLTIVYNVTLVLMLKPATWARFLVWFVIGALIYVFYGYRHSNVGQLADTEMEDFGKLSKAYNARRNGGANYGSTGSDR